MSLKLPPFAAMWQVLAQAATWAVALVVLFVVAPPRLQVDEPPTTIDRFVEFALAIVIGIAFALSSRKRKPEFARRWAVLAGVLLVAGVALFWTYSYRYEHWTCQYDSGAPMVRGSTYRPEPAQYAARTPGIDCRGMLRDYAGAATELWDEAELKNRRLILSGLFAAVVIVLALSALSVLQALAARPSDAPKRRVRAQKPGSA